MGMEEKGRDGEEGGSRKVMSLSAAHCHSMRVPVSSLSRALFAEAMPRKGVLVTGERLFTLVGSVSSLFMAFLRLCFLVFMSCPGNYLHGIPAHVFTRF